ncbi:MAG: hypothetical protein K2K80_06545 [Clostridia bacterium]|nr:hypothetical protein [Clostridia bacterium]
MGKVKSAIITALLVAAIVVLWLFAAISCNVPGTDGVKRYNSFLSGIHLGSDLTGEAYTLLYPNGVISAKDYKLVMNDDENEDKEEYQYYEEHGGVYVDKDKFNDEELLSSVKKDAEIISKRLSQKGYSSYSVTVEDDYVIRVSVPTNFTYAAYKEYDNTSRSSSLNLISTTIQLVMVDGQISLRDNTDYDSSNSLLSIKEDFATYFKDISYYVMGGTHAVKLDLTNEGFNKLNNVLLLGDSDSKAYIYVGETNIGLQFDMGSSLENKTLYFSSEANRAQDFAILLGSVINGNVLTNRYNDTDSGASTQLIVSTPAFGEYAAIYLLAVLIVALIAAIVVPVIKYKKLGFVNALMALAYSLVIVISLLLLEIQLTVGGAFIAVLGLVLLTFTNVKVFEAVRAETKNGRTIQASVKTGYKKTLFSVLDVHILLAVISIIVALVCVGELAACGFILLIATLASYVLYWFTRFMWYVLSTPVRDKFKFCGFAREVYDDED